LSVVVNECGLNRAQIVRSAKRFDRRDLATDNVDRQGSVNETSTGTNYFAGGNVRLSCRGQQLTMQSDSVAAYGGNVVQFIGNVHYRDSTLTMDADNGTYAGGTCPSSPTAFTGICSSVLKRLTGATVSGITVTCYEGSTTCSQWYKMERPGVLLEDGHPTHVTWAVADVDKDNQIPAGSNHGSKVIVVPFDGVAAAAVRLGGTRPAIFFRNHGVAVGSVLKKASS
jgi:hypothetical protein